MPIIASEIQTFAAETNNDTSGNGGRISANQIATGVKNNVWPDVPEAERTAGSTKYRKTFIKISNDADLDLQSSRIFVETATAGDDRVLIFPGTQRDTQNDISSPDLYGAGDLNTNVSGGAGTIIVDVEAGADLIFRDGGLIRISDRATIDGAGNEEFLRLANPGGVSYLSDVATLTLDSGVTTANAYTVAGGTKVASVIEQGTIGLVIDNYAESTASGTFDEIGNPITGDNIGTIEQTWTLTFSSATNFSVIGDTVGAVGSGSISTDFSPNNPSHSKPYFTLPSAAWGGTWASSETLVFQTHPAAAPIWQQRIVPAGAASLSSNDVRVGIDGQTT